MPAEHRAGGERDITRNHEAGRRLRRLMDDDWQWSLEQYPEMATQVGHPGYNDRWTNHSAEAITTLQTHVRASLAALMTIDREDLPAADGINHDFYRHQLELDVAAQAFPEDLLPINQMSGVQHSLAETILLMPRQTTADYEDRLARLAGVPQVIRETMALLQRGVAAGVTVPRVTLRDVPDQIRAVISAHGPLLQPFSAFPVSCSAPEQDDLRSRAETVVAGDPPLRLPDGLQRRLGALCREPGRGDGFYTDPYARFGQLTYEMWRAIRLVVDTGLHAMGWSRRQAVDYFAGNAGKSEHDIVVEVDRYIVWPGQALAYKIGELKIRELRKYAEMNLGTAFDIRAFHDTVLAEGSLPLKILEERFHAWVASQEGEQERFR